MKLKDYLNKNGLKQQFFANLIGIKPPTLSCYIHGHLYPRESVLKLIEIHTKGAVTKADFPPIEKKRPRTLTLVDKNDSR